jgi:DNA-binding response OmpR family regulator
LRPPPLVLGIVVPINVDQLRRQLWEEHTGFQDLMPRRVGDILLVMSLYDRFILEQDGQLNEFAIGQVLELNFTRTPGLTRVPTGADALQVLEREPGRYNLVLVSPTLPDMTVDDLTRKVRKAGHQAAVVLLGYDASHLTHYVRREKVRLIDAAFLWQGDARILPSIVNMVEDRWNVRQDCDRGGVQVILLIEDSTVWYSSFLPEIYDEILRHTRRVLKEGVNLAHRLLRLRARPKVVLCTDLQDAEQALEEYGQHVLGVVSDVEVPRRGRATRRGGIRFARRVKEEYPDVPVLLHSSRSDVADSVRAIGADFVHKHSPTLLSRLRRFLRDYVAIGDFVFRQPDGTEMARARTLEELVDRVRVLPDEVLNYHGTHNHFSSWLRARTEFTVARRLRPVGVDEFQGPEGLRGILLHALESHLWERQMAALVDFDPERFDAERDFARIGGGSVGGKARGLAFVRYILAHRSLTAIFPRVRISVPPGVVLGTEVFDSFMEDNDLVEFALKTEHDKTLDLRFDMAALPPAVEKALEALLKKMDGPLAVRSSSLLEDSYYQPFAGIYDTIILTNDHPDPKGRLHDLVRAIKRVYASTFHLRARAFLQATPYRLEEEKMAVAVMKLVGAERNGRFYPDFAGAAQSWNFYAVPPLAPDEGIAAAVLGLGESVVEGASCRRFSPRRPSIPGPWNSPRNLAENAQRSFRALRMGDQGGRIETFELAEAERDGTLGLVGATWQPQNDAVYDGISRPGVRLVTFGTLLKYNLFPLAGILDILLGLGSFGLNTPVELEFAVNLDVPDDKPREFQILQLRPLVVSRETEAFDIEDFEDGQLVCRSSRVMGNGRVDVHDVIVVDRVEFDRKDSRAVARQIATLNNQLVREERPYALIGVGRWGSRDPWLGIPVEWAHISGARAIVETAFADMEVEPSQGTHFFQNLSALGVGYFTVNPRRGDGLLDWDWLAHCPSKTALGPVRHLRFAAPLTVLMNGRNSEGVITRPGVGPLADYDDTGVAPTIPDTLLF